MLDICDKARFLSCRVASCRRPPHITRFSCRGGGGLVVSRRAMCGGHNNIILQYNWSNNRANNMALIKVGHKLILTTIHYINSFEGINCLYKNIEE